MNKNVANIYQFVLRDMIGQGMTGLSPTVRIRKDSGSFAATTNTPTEIGYGAYEVILTATECNCDVMMFMVTLPDGQFPAILENERLITTGGATPAEIWGYNGQGGRTVTNTIPTAADNATAVWGAQTKEVTIATAQANTFATASALSSVASNVSAVKAKTDNLPESPAAVGSEMTLTSTTITSIQNGLATNDIISSLASHGDTYWVTANVSGLATGGGLEALANYGDSHWSTANVSALATADALSSVATTTTAIKAKTDLLPAEPAAKSDIPSVQTIQSGLATSDSLSSAQTAIINRGNEAWKTATGFATPTNVTDAVTTLEAYGDQHWQGGSGGVTPGGERPLYCTTAMLYAHWTQTKIDTWANGSQTAIDNAIEWACNKIDSDLQNATSVPFQPVPASIRDLAILAAGARLADLAGASAEPDVKAAWAYYQEFVENYNYHVDNQQ